MQPGAMCLSEEQVPAIDSVEIAQSADEESEREKRLSNAEPVSACRSSFPASSNTVQCSRSNLIQTASAFFDATTIPKDTSAATCSSSYARSPVNFNAQRASSPASFASPKFTRPASAPPERPDAFNHVATEHQRLMSTKHELESKVLHAQLGAVEEERNLRKFLLKKHIEAEEEKRQLQRSLVELQMEAAQAQVDYYRSLGNKLN
jgi:hypothetical protein